jgi:hypothetical protein
MKPNSDQARQDNQYLDTLATKVLKLDYRINILSLANHFYNW